MLVVASSRGPNQEDKILSTIRGKDHFGELRFYWFGLRTGFANLLQNGLRLGLKKTAGKITQPVNSYTRFPEYALMENAIHTFFEARKGSETLQVLDVGSPKCFGLYLASTMRLEVEMTDISSLNLDEYKAMWEAIRGQARGTCRFAIQDARALKYAANEFDVVYSMSVIEHIEGAMGDLKAIREMARVLKPGGLLLFSVPVGQEYVEQYRGGLAHAVERTAGKSLHFFQRIYNASALESRILVPLAGLRVRSEWTVWREKGLLIWLFKSLGENLRGMLGFLNPWLSVWCNRCASGFVEPIPGSYREVYSPRDSYGDVVLVAEKEVS